ncbi:hypothetical protein KGM_214969 [Danaus plexippus plexippus]|uniref:Uncharacterized protein n=1 Tax=Danaus plexippus plexippus TaxID=278856 RepID=A0A212ERN8_DANPL|nr:hypothetical protein KGM_214969 [Danaus plexippus plexippus]
MVIDNKEPPVVLYCPQRALTSLLCPPLCLTHSANRGSKWPELPKKLGREAFCATYQTTRTVNIDIEKSANSQFKEDQNRRKASSSKLKEHEDEAEPKGKKANMLKARLLLLRGMLRTARSPPAATSVAKSAEPKQLSSGLG